MLVGNKCDQHDDRMVTIDEGRKRHKDIFCESFHEISVRESYEEVNAINVSSINIFYIFYNKPGVQCIRRYMQILASV